MYGFACAVGRGLQDELERRITFALQELVQRNGGLILGYIRNSRQGGEDMLELLDVDTHVLKLDEEVVEGPFSPVNILSTEGWEACKSWLDHPRP